MTTISGAFATAVQHHRAGRLQTAEEIYRQIVSVEPNHARAHNNLGVACMEQGRPDEAIACYRRALDLNGDHCQALFTVPLFAAHDHGQFEVVCYADVARPDATTARLRSCADTWRDIARLDHEKVAELIYEDRIDILVDLTMHMARQYYHGIDIALDTVPYNGHTTSLDALWMGVPVVTLVGQTVVGRAGLCQLMNLGLPELIASGPEQYVQIAVELARDLSRLRGLRATLRQRMRTLRR